VEPVSIAGFCGEMCRKIDIRCAAKRTLIKKRAEEVVYVLLDILTTFSAPSILLNGNGREFANTIVKELCAICGQNSK